MLERECVEMFELQESTHLFTAPVSATFYRQLFTFQSRKKQFIAKHTLFKQVIDFKLMELFF